MKTFKHKGLEGHKETEIEGIKNFPLWDLVTFVFNNLPGLPR